MPMVERTSGSPLASTFLNSEDHAASFAQDIEGVLESRKRRLRIHSTRSPGRTQLLRIIARQPSRGFGASLACMYLPGDEEPGTGAL